jgi:hypothetical protein
MGNSMGSGGNRRGSGKAGDGPSDRPPLQGVIMVSVGSNRRSAAPKGATRAHVARIHDLPSLIHAFVDEGTER